MTYFSTTFNTKDRGVLAFRLVVAPSLGLSPAVHPPL